MLIPIDFNVNTPTRREDYTPDVDVTDNYDITMMHPHSRLLNERVYSLECTSHGSIRSIPLQLTMIQFGENAHVMQTGMCTDVLLIKLLMRIPVKLSILVHYLVMVHTCTLSGNSSVHYLVMVVYIIW